MRTTQRKKVRFHHWRLIPTFCLIILLVLFSISMHKLSHRNAIQEKATLEKAISRTITQCYALEGIYPPDLEYMENHYGLTYNEDQFYVDYQYIGSNLRPDVTIIER